MLLQLNTIALLLLGTGTSTAQLAESSTGVLSIPAVFCDGQPVEANAELSKDGVTQRKWLSAQTKINLASGKWTIRVSSGPHCRYVERELAIRAGETIDFGAAQLERVVDLRKRGWYAGIVGAGKAHGLDWSAPFTTARIGQIGALGLPMPLPVNLELLPSYAALTAWRSQGAATIASTLHAGLPFDLGAARLVDGLIVTEDSERSLKLWSLLLDQGYLLAPIAGSQAQLYVQCDKAFSLECLADAVRQRRTIVSTGPILHAAAAGIGRITVEAWPRQDQPDRLLRVEVWAHNRVIATRAVMTEEAQHLAATLDWVPESASDWVAVRVVSEGGWALSSAFFAGPLPETGPLSSRVKIVFPEVASHQQGMIASVWPMHPTIPGAQPLHTVEMDGNAVEISAPAASLIRVELPDGRLLDTRLPDASGVRALFENPATSERRREALLDWSLWEEVLRRSRRIVIESRL